MFLAHLQCASVAVRFSVVVASPDHLCFGVRFWFILEFQEISESIYIPSILASVELMSVPLFHLKPTPPCNCATHFALVTLFSWLNPTAGTYMFLKR